MFICGVVLLIPRYQHIISYRSPARYAVRGGDFETVVLRFGISFFHHTRKVLIVSKTIIIVLGFY